MIDCGDARSSGEEARDLVLHLVARGSFHTVVAVADAHGCPLWEFLTRIRLTNPHEWSRLMARLTRLAEHGRGPSSREFRFLQGHELFEVKSSGGGRILAFYDAERVVVCTSGFVKKRERTPRAEIERALWWRARYRRARRLGLVRGV